MGVVLMHLPLMLCDWEVLWEVLSQVLSQIRIQASEEFRIQDQWACKVWVALGHNLAIDKMGACRHPWGDR